MRARPSLLSVALLLLAAGCSGGGSGSSEPTPTATPSPTGTGTPSPTPTPTPSAYFTISASPALLHVPQGGSASLDVTIVPVAGFTETVTVTIDGLPAGVTASALSIAPPATTGTITLASVETAAEPTPVEATVRGQSPSGPASWPFKLTVRGAPGDVDLSFGENGWVMALGMIEDVTLQNGKILVTGSHWDTPLPLACRFHPDGKADTTFGDAGGCAHAAGPVAVGTGRVIEVHGGMIYVAGRKSAGFLARLTANGALDPTFGVAGIVLLGASLDPNRIRFDANGIIVAGQFQEELVRVRMDGSIDDAFLANQPDTTGGFRDLVRLDDGRLIAASGTKVFAFDADGTPDTGFGAGGSVEVPILSPWVEHKEVLVLSVDGKGALLAGGFGMAVTRFSTAGTVIESYPAMEPGDDWQGLDRIAYPHDLWVLDDGTMVMAGDAMSDIHYGTVGRRLPGGAADEEFGPDGLRIYFNEGDFRGVEVLPDGRYLVVGGGFSPQGLLYRIWD